MEIQASITQLLKRYFKNVALFCCTFSVPTTRVLLTMDERFPSFFLGSHITFPAPYFFFRHDHNLTHLDIERIFYAPSILISIIPTKSLHFLPSSLVLLLHLSSCLFFLSSSSSFVLLFLPHYLFILPFLSS